MSYNYSQRFLNVCARKSKDKFRDLSRSLTELINDLLQTEDIFSFWFYESLSCVSQLVFCLQNTLFMLHIKHNLQKFFSAIVNRLCKFPKDRLIKVYSSISGFYQLLSLLVDSTNVLGYSMFLCCIIFLCCMIFICCIMILCFIVVWIDDDWKINWKCWNNGKSIEKLF